MKLSRGSEFGIVLGSNLFIPGSRESLTMAKATMLFLFLTSFWGCHAQLTMIQPPSMSASIGETVKISCRLNGDSISSSYISWYQQKPGSAPILLIYYGSSRASGISDRFSGSVDSSASTATLTISSVQEGDEADYHCLYYYSSSKNTMIQAHGEVGQKPPCIRYAVHWLCLADAPAGFPVNSMTM
ncbi:UNVERIFIED_CONTAM: hypothetical protein K2H54_021989 [Gekko kuhli]